MEEKNITEQESLAIIDEMIQRAKNSYIDNGIVPLFWGVLITFCSLFLYCEIKFKFDIHFDIFLLALIACLPSIYYSLRNRKAKGFVSHTDITMRAVWGTFLIGIFFGSWYNSASQSSHIPYFIFMYSVPTYITGVVCKFKPMTIGGIIVWVLAFISCKVSTPNNLLLMAASATVAWLIPGIILRRSYLRLMKRGNV